MHKSGKQWRTLLSLGLAVWFALPQSSVQAMAHKSPGKKQILVLGDSLSEGYQLKSDEAWPSLIADKLTAAGLKFEVTSASRTGRTATDGLAELPSHLKQSIDIFVLQLGVNDAFRHVSLPEIQTNLQAIISRVRAKNPAVRIIIAGMQLPDSSPGGYFRRFGEMYVDLAGKNHALLLPYLLRGVAGNPALTIADQFHPNSAGHKIIAQNIWKLLEPIARELSQRGG